MWRPGSLCLPLNMLKSCNYTTWVDAQQAHSYQFTQNTWKVFMSHLQFAEKVSYRGCSWRFERILKLKQTSIRKTFNLSLMLVNNIPAIYCCSLEQSVYFDSCHVSLLTACSLTNDYKWNTLTLAQGHLSHSHHFLVHCATYSLPDLCQDLWITDDKPM